MPVPAALHTYSFSFILVTMGSYIKRQIALPQDHGSWVFILSPLLIGFFAGGFFNYASFNLLIAAMSAFLIRQPLTVAVKALSGRRSAADLPAAWFWVLVYGVISALALVGLILEGFGFVLYLAAPGIPVFAWHLWLVRKRAERRQAGIEVIATGVLALSAPAAYWVARGGYDPAGWWLWLFCWLQSAASILYAYLRLNQRDVSPEQAQGQGRSDWLRLGRRALLYTSFNLGLSTFLGWADIVPSYIFIPFLIQWFETLWGIFNPAVGWKPTRIGVRQLIVSIIWTVFFIISWSA